MAELEKEMTRAVKAMNDREGKYLTFLSPEKNTGLAF